MSEVRATLPRYCREIASFVHGCRQGSDKGDLRRGLGLGVDAPCGGVRQSRKKYGE